MGYYSEYFKWLYVRHYTLTRNYKLIGRKCYNKIQSGRYLLSKTKGYQCVWSLYQFD